MTKYLMSVVLLSAALAAACGGSSNETQQTPPPAVDPASPAEAPPASTPPPATPAEPVPTQSAPPRRSAARPFEEASRPAAAPAPAPVASAAPSAPPARPAEPPRPVFRDVDAPTGTALSLSLITPLSSATAKVETPVTARLRQPIVVDGFTVVPAGATLHGDVTEVERAGRVKGRSRLVIRFAEVQVNGQRDPFRTNALTFEGEATKSEDATKVGGGAGIGAVIGGIIGGASGAAKGAAIGGAAGAGTVLATRGREVELAEGTELNASLASPYSVRVEVK
jgi:hypothetical protein